jgi:cyclin T
MEEEASATTSQLRDPSTLHPSNSPSWSFFLQRLASKGEDPNSPEVAKKAALKENEYRHKSVQYIQHVGQRLRMPQLTIATAIVFYHRFYLNNSYEQYDRFVIANTCLFLAGKVEETPKKLKDVVIESYKAQHQKQDEPHVVVPGESSKEFWEIKEHVLVSERILLQSLGFDLSVEHPYRPLLAYVKSIQGTRELAQVAWNFTNDSLKSAVVVLGFAPRAIAAAAVSLAAQYVQQGESALPRCGPNKELPWYTAFKVEHASVESIKEQIIEMYGGSLPPKVSNSTLGNSVAEGLVHQPSPTAAPGTIAAGGTAAMKPPPPARGGACGVSRRSPDLRFARRLGGGNCRLERAVGGGARQRLACNGLGSTATLS